MQNVEKEQEEQTRLALEDRKQRVQAEEVKSRRAQETALIAAKEERRKIRAARAQQSTARKEERARKQQEYEANTQAYQLQLRRDANVNKLSKAVWMWKMPRKSNGGTGRKTQVYLVLVQRAYHVCWVSRSPTKDSKFPLVHGTELLLGQEADRLLSTKRKNWLHRMPEKEFALALRNPDKTLLFLVCTKEAEYNLWSSVLSDILSV
jgi:hypothetical protein